MRRRTGKSGCNPHRCRGLSFATCQQPLSVCLRVLLRSSGESSMCEGIEEEETVVAVVAVVVQVVAVVVAAAAVKAVETGMRVGNMVVRCSESAPQQRGCLALRERAGGEHACST